VPGEFPEGWRELAPSREDWLTEEEWVARVSSEEDEEWAASDEEDVNDKPSSGDPAGSDAPKPSGSRAAKGGVRVVKGIRRGPGSPGPAGQARTAWEHPRRQACSRPGSSAASITITLATLLDLAERPGEISGIGPIDPDPEANTSDRYRTLTRLPAYLDRGRCVRDCQIPASASGSR
jgi:hypothetical protein